MTVDDAGAAGPYRVLSEEKTRSSADSIAARLNTAAQEGYVLKHVLQDEHMYLFILQLEN